MPVASTKHKTPTPVRRVSSSVQRTTEDHRGSRGSPRIKRIMAEFSRDIEDRSEAAEADQEDKGLGLKPHAQAHLLSATEYCKVKLVYVKVL